MFAKSAFPKAHENKRSIKERTRLLNLWTHKWGEDAHSAEIPVGLCLLAGPLYPNKCPYADTSGRSLVSLGLLTCTRERHRVFPKVIRSRSFFQTFGISLHQSQSLHAGCDRETCVLTASSCQAATALFCGPGNFSHDLNTDQCSYKEKKTPLAHSVTTAVFWWWLYSGKSQGVDWGLGYGSQPCWVWGFNETLCDLHF